MTATDIETTLVGRPDLERPSSPRAGVGRRRAGSTALHVGLVVAGVAMVFPFAWMLITSFKTLPQLLQDPRSESLVQKPIFVVATKLDATTTRERLDALREFAREKGFPFFAISSASGEGIQPLVRAIANALEKIPAEKSEAAGETGMGSNRAALQGKQS